MGAIVEWFIANVGLAVFSLLTAAALWLLMPRPSGGGVMRYFGGVCGVAALLVGGLSLMESTGSLTRDIVFCVFSLIAICGAVLTITSHNPVYGALWFAAATLGVCGLFLMGLAPFLAAATVIVYAGAIVVTFLFVMMLAQQHGYTEYDSKASQPLAAIVVAIALLGGVLGASSSGPEEGAVLAKDGEPAVGKTMANPLSESEDRATDSMRDLGRSLFGDYLFAVELAGTVLMLAAIGAIAIVPRRSRGSL